MAAFMGTSSSRSLIHMVGRRQAAVSVVSAALKDNDMNYCDVTPGSMRSI